MRIDLEIDGEKFAIDPRRSVDISIPLQFNGPQPNAYGVPGAASVPCKAGELVGDTRRGGSCNFEQYTLIPHCNGTHTECIGHITDDRISVRDCLQEVFIPAALISVAPIRVAESDETYAIKPQPDDLLITRKILKAAFGSPLRAEALIIRTLPNEDSKLIRQYGQENIPAYFTTEAMDFVFERGIRHLLVDVPSVDRLFDEGKLANHRIFWNVEQGSREVNNESRVSSTITEMIYVPDAVSDGEYLLNLQIAPFAADSSPSRPILVSIK